MDKPLISIIVPVYKVERYLRRCIDSVVNQSYDNTQIILVDDGSPDKCGEICDQYASVDQRIEVVHKTNGGLSDARNVGLDLARGDYISFIDSDDFVHRDYLLSLYEACRNNNCEVAQCSFIRGVEDTFPPDDGKQEEIGVFDHLRVFEGRALKVTAWGKLYKSELFLNLRFPVGKINEDEFVTYKAVYRANWIGLISKAYYYYYQSSESIMRNSKKEIKLDFVQAFQERILFFQEQGERDLVTISRKEFAIRLMLYYMKYRSLLHENRNLLLELFRINYKGLVASRAVSPIEKLILFAFRMSPDLCTLFVGRVLR